MRDEDRVGQVWEFHGKMFLMIAARSRVPRGFSHPALCLDTGQRGVVFEWDYAGLEEDGERIA